MLVDSDFKAYVHFTVYSLPLLGGKTFEIFEQKKRPNSFILNTKFPETKGMKCSA